MRLVAAVGLALMLGCSSPGSEQPAAVRTSDPFQALTKLPLTLPRIAQGQPCPKSEPRDLGTHLGAALGDGPAYALGENLGDLFRRTVGHPTKVAWATGPTYQGPIRIRGRRLDARGEVLFESFDNRWRGEPVRRVDGANLMGELDFLESHSYFPNTPVGWRIWPTGTYVEAPGCQAWQVDGIGFTEVITIQV